MRFSCCPDRSVSHWDPPCSVRSMSIYNTDNQSRDRSLCGLISLELVKCEKHHKTCCLSVSHMRLSLLCRFHLTSLPGHIQKPAVLQKGRGLHLDIPLCYPLDAGPHPQDKLSMPIRQGTYIPSRSSGMQRQKLGSSAFLLDIRVVRGR